MTPHIILFSLAVIGIGVMAYLITKRIAHERPVCIVGEECHKVLESKYNKIFVIYNDVIGLFFYVGIAALVSFLLIGFGPSKLWEIVLKISVAGAAVFSLFLTYLQWRVIKAWCFWCVISAIISFLMAAVVFA